MPTIIDLNAEAAKLTMFRGLTTANDARGAQRQRRAIASLP